MTDVDMEIGDDPMVCHLCDQDFAGSEIVEHLKSEHGVGVSVVSPDEARKLRDRLTAIAHRDLDDRTITPGEAATLLSALDALEQGGKAESGGTAELSPVVKTLEEELREARAIISDLEDSTDYRVIRLERELSRLKDGRSDAYVGQRASAALPGPIREDGPTSERPTLEASKRRVVVREEEWTEMWVATEGEAKAFAKQLIRDGKTFKCEPCEPCTDEGWSVTVYEFNHPNKWEAGA